VIGKVLRGTNVRRLLYYLYGPGKSNEHDDPHLIAGFSDPADLEPERRRDGSRDFRRLTGLLTQPLAALAGPGYAKPVWHCSVRAAPEDRLLSDAEWAQIAARVMDRTGLAPAGDELGVRWVAVRHGADHLHLVATLARQDGTRPRIWNDFYRVREACQDAERQFGLRATAAADRTAARRPSRAETEQSARRGWREPPRVMLRRAVCTAAGGAGSEQEFFTRLADAGVTVRKRCSTTNPGEVTGYAVGLPSHTARGEGIVWYSGGKLAADLTLPKLRRRWTGPEHHAGTFTGSGLSAKAARAVLRNMVTTAAEQARDEDAFFAGLREAGAQVRLRFSETTPGQVTGYAVGLSGHDGPDGALVWYGGGRLAASLTLPRLRRRWSSPKGTAERSGTFRFTVPERNAIFEHAAQQASLAADHVRIAAQSDPTAAGDAAWAAADVLHVAARALRSPELRHAADSYDRAARERYGRIPLATRQGSQLRRTARMIALAGQITGDGTMAAIALVANLAALAAAVTELRAAQQHAIQAAAARATAERLRTMSPVACAGPAQSQSPSRRHSHAKAASKPARGGFRLPTQPATLAAARDPARPRHAPASNPSQRGRRE
jgi:hypothetical protein